MHRRHAKERDDLGPLCAVALVGRIPDRTALSEIAHHLFDIAFFNRIVRRNFTPGTLDLRDEFAAVFAIHGVERRASERQLATGYFQRREMRAEQNDAPAFVERVLQVLVTVQTADPRMSSIARPAAEPCLDQRHAQGFEVTFRERVPLFSGKIRETEFEVSANDRAPRPRDPVRNPAELLADPE